MDEKNFVGTIVAVTDENLDFQVDGKPYQFNLQQIEKARLVPKY